MCVGGVSSCFWWWGCRMEGVCVCVGGCGCGGVWKVCVVWVESAPFGGKVWCECGWSHFLLVVRCVCVCVRSEWVDGLAL